MTVDRADGDPNDRADEPVERRNRWSGPAPRMGDMTHVHTDHDPRAWHWFTRGPLVAADGGDRGDDPATPASDRTVDDEHLRDVAHEPATGDGVNRVWDRGERDEDGV